MLLARMFALGIVSSLAIVSCSEEGSSGAGGAGSTSTDTTTGAGGADPTGGGAASGGAAGGSAAGGGGAGGETATGGAGGAEASGGASGATGSGGGSGNPSLPFFSDICMGGNHTCALTLGGGEVWCWGDNAAGELGIPGLPEHNNPPTKVPGLDDNVVQLACGGNSTCVLQGDGSVSCWGGNKSGQLGRGTATVSEGAPAPATEAGILVEHITIGVNHACAHSLGAIKCWGDNTWGQLGDGIATHGDTCLTVPDEGSPPLDCSLSAVTVTVPYDPNVGTPASVSAGRHTTCALFPGVVVRCWGRGDTGQLGNGASGSSNTPVDVVGLNAPVGVAVGDGSACAWRQDGDAFCWGEGEYGQLGDGSTNHEPCQVAWGTRDCATAPVTVAQGDMLRLAPGSTTCASLKDATARCWGFNQFGQVGNGSTFNGAVPAPVDIGLSDVMGIAVGTQAACAIATGDAYCWGWNDSAKLGIDPAIPSVSSPTLVGW